MNSYLILIIKCIISYVFNFAQRKKQTIGYAAAADEKIHSRYN